MKNDIDEVLLDIDEGRTILAGIRACRFIAALINWPGVSEAIREIGGWDTVESLASNLRKCNLRNEMPEQYHFTLLENIVQTMLKIIQLDTEEMGAVEKMCENRFRKVWNRFRCGTRNRELVDLNPPCIKTFQSRLKDRNRTRFPSIGEVSVWE